MHSMSVDQRRTFVKGLHLCTNCLRPGHDNDNCKSKSSCYICNKNHNTLLHIERQNSVTHSGDSNVTDEAGSRTTLTCASKSADPFKDQSVTSLVASSSALDDTVQRFWESEEPSKCKISGPKDEVHEVCEQKSGTYRTPEDRRE
ncbi:hypothetical protein B5X24_HaOG206814 [Helicoverpa armigera]|uniref:CCHC-type domain-containing protein n=1 Tax=Helicoverpa armigera TaxID=29058 RepID=A0A2W1BTI2_HELAM|nr:hypothetical protein B5X24_HaOG206814 [Helicoverpa armigera]